MIVAGTGMSSSCDSAAYARAPARFAHGCDARGIALAALTPVIVAAYVEELGPHAAKPTVDTKSQHITTMNLVGMRIGWMKIRESGVQ